MLKTVEDEFFNKIITTLCEGIPPSVLTDGENLQIISWLGKTMNNIKVYQVSLFSE